MNDEAKLFVIPACTWAAKPVSVEPEIQLARWAVYEIPGQGRFLSGYNVGGHHGRASTAITAWDGTTRTGITSSGRRYRLVGEPGFDGDAKYVWRVFSRGDAYVEVTEKYLLEPTQDE
ncbi:MAG: hypothetical protein PF483_07985 [Halothiobacillus sp.]|jgi:hypothetical protein|nr:hypothetical protein [Halothiobacillus sp.]